MALSDTSVRGAKAREKAYRLSDAQGMYLWVTPAGGKLWRWAYVFAGKEKLMSLGRYPEVSLAEARNRLGVARRLLAAGTDPMEERKAAKRESRAAHLDSFASVSAEWLEHWQEGKSSRHVEYTRRRVETNLLPVLGSKGMRQIEAPEIVTLVKAIEQRGARDIAKRALETTGQIFRYAIAHGYATRNPVAEVRPSDFLRRSKRVNLARIDAAELPALLRAIELYPGRHVTRLAIRLLALTFVRTSELIHARWAEIDEGAARWNIPAERMKMRTPHIVPLAKQTLACLSLLRVLTGGGELLFPGDRKASRPMSNMTILKGLERMGYKGRMTGHGFRGLASTTLHEQGYAHEHIELQLAHAPRNAVSAAYNHALHLNARARMMQDWADYLDQRQREEPPKISLHTL